MDGFVFVVPLLCYAVLFFGYLELVRPKPNSTLWVFDTRTQQVSDLFFGTGGIQGFQPLNPSVSAALQKRAKESAAKNAPSQAVPPTEPTTEVSEPSAEMPWIYPPWQTWAYVGGFVTLCVIAFRTWTAGKKSVAALQQKHFSVDSLQPGSAPHPSLIKAPEFSKEAK